jgi:hypothetical protein
LTKEAEPAGACPMADEKPWRKTESEWCSAGLDRPEIAEAVADHGSWGAPECVAVGSIMVPTDRVPVDEDVVAAIVATINAGNVNALPPIHV